MKEYLEMPGMSHTRSLKAMLEALDAETTNSLFILETTGFVTI